MGFAVKSLGKIIRTVQAFGRELSRKNAPTVSSRAPSIGIALGYGVSEAVKYYNNWPALVPMSAVLTAVAFSAAVGILVPMIRSGTTVRLRLAAPASSRRTKSISVPDGAFASGA